MQNRFFGDDLIPEADNNMRKSKKSIVRYLRLGSLLVTVCAWIQAGSIVAAEPEQKKSSAIEASRAIDGKVEHLVNCEDASSWEGMVKVNTEIKRSGQFSFELYGSYPTEIICKQMIPIALDKTYKLSVWMRTLDAQLPASGFFGLRMYDKDKKPININNVAVLPATETTLAADAVKDTKELIVLKNEEWLKPKNSSVAFNIEDKYQDLPNFDLSRVDKIVDEGGQYKVILQTPLEKTYPSGTKVRLHAPWGAPFYWVASGWMPTEWKQFSATVQGETQSCTPKDKFWKGTKYVRVFAWFGNYDKIPKKGARLLVDDIEFTVSDGENSNRK